MCIGGRRNVPARKPIGKRLRFAIFARDQFTCRYCGAQPPEVVLHVDHVLPVSKGGTNEESNLVTACQACNLGKSARKLDSVLVPTDADLRYLELMQEKAELERSARVAKELDDLRHNVAVQLQRMAYDASDEKVVAPLTNIKQMLVKYDFETVSEALRVAALAVATFRINRYSMMQYAGGVAKRKSEENPNG
jgi:hypothetical protein